MASRKENFVIGLMVSTVLSPITFYLPKGPGFSIFLGSSILVSVFSFFVAPRYVLAYIFAGNSMFGSQKEGSRDALFAHAQTFMITKEYEKALEVYFEIIEKYPHEVLAYRSMLDIICGEFQDYPRGEKVFRKLLRNVRDKGVQKKLFAVYNEVSQKQKVDLVKIV